MSENYNVYKVWIEEAEFEILVLEIPESELNDKLAFLARDKGNITRSFYEDFLIANCLANVNQLLFHIRQQAEGVNLLKIREEIMDEILKINPLLDPNNLVINRNYVVKLKEGEKLDKDEKLLVDNKHWNMSCYEESIEDAEIDHEGYADVPNKKGKKAPSEMKKIEDLEFTIVKKWWGRINKYLEIKKFAEKDMGHILSSRFFHNRSSFQTYIVTVCVVDSEDLFTLLDNMGIPSRVAPPTLMHEVYELCREANPFLTFDNAKDLVEEEEQDDGEQCPHAGPPNRMASHAQQTRRKKKTKKKKFKDVPKTELLNLSDMMKVFVIGQDRAIDELVEAIQRASVGLKDPVKPIGSFLFAGRTGIGKTLTTKVLADELIKDRNNLLTIDCSEYSADHEYAKLIGCFVPGTKIKMADGTEKNIEEITVGEEIISHTGRKRAVEYVHEYDQDGTMIQLLAANNNVPVITTKTHEILAIKGEKCAYTNRKHVVCKPKCTKDDCSFRLHKDYELEWIPAGELKVGDVVACPRYKPNGDYPRVIDLARYVDDLPKYKYDDESVWGQEHVKVPRYIDINEDFVRLAGYYVSEGGSKSSKKTINFTFNYKEANYVMEVVKLVRRIFGKAVRIRVEDRSQAGSCRVWISSRIINILMEDLFGGHTYVKKIPAWFKEMPDDLVKSFLETAVFGDGCTVIPRCMDYSTVSSALFTHMELLFRRLGYITYKQLEPVRGNTKRKMPRYRLYIGGNQVEKLNTDFDFDVNLSGMRSTNIQRKAWVDEDYVYFQLKEVKEVEYTGKVYDLAVKEDTSYITEFAVHNSPSGYVGHEQGGILTNAIMENPFSVVVFDEIEKASTKIYDLMLQILEEGRLTDGKGQKVSFKDTIVIMTSNIGVGEVDDIKKTIGFGDVAKLTEEKKTKAIDEAIKKKFKPEFLNRIDGVIHFNSLAKEDYMRIIDLELYKLNDNLKNNDTEFKSLTLKFDKRTKGFIFKHGIDEDFGARPLKRCIEKEIATPLAARLLRGDIPIDAEVKVTIKNGKTDFSFMTPTRDEEEDEDNILRNGAS